MENQIILTGAEANKYNNLKRNLAKVKNDWDGDFESVINYVFSTYMDLTELRTYRNEVIRILNEWEKDPPTAIKRLNKLTIFELSSVETTLDVCNRHYEIKKLMALVEAMVYFAQE